MHGILLPFKTLLIKLLLYYGGSTEDMESTKKRVKTHGREDGTDLGSDLF